MEVCIIGGGNNGIYAAKCCLDHGLTPFILDKKPLIGGLWLGLPGEVGAWASMYSNTSKYMSGLSDMLWSQDDPDFPHASKVLEYLQNYSAKHHLDQYFHSNCDVTLVEKIEDGYLVKWKKDDILTEKVFYGVIIASGKFSTGKMPFTNIHEFTGEIVAAGTYRTPDIFTGKKVVVIGNAFSGPDIALEALQTAETVSIIYKRKYIYLTRYTTYGIPQDFPMLFMNSPIRSSLIPNLKENANFCRNFVLRNDNPGKYLPEWEIDDSTLETEFCGFSVCKEEFLAAISEKRIHAIQGSVTDVYANGVVLADGQHIEADVIVNASGYITEYDFLSEEIKRIIQYDPENRLLPRVLYRYILHPDLPRLCFLGTPVLIPGKFELPTEIGVRYIAGTLNISREELEQGVKDEEYIRTMFKNGLHMPYGITAYFHECIRILGIKIDTDFIENDLQFGKGPFLPYFLHTETEEQREICRRAVQEIKEKFPFYEFS